MMSSFRWIITLLLLKHKVTFHFNMLYDTSNWIAFHSGIPFTSARYIIFQVLTFNGCADLLSTQSVWKRNCLLADGSVKTVMLNASLLLWEEERAHGLSGENTHRLKQEHSSVVCLGIFSPPPFLKLFLSLIAKNLLQMISLSSAVTYKPA